MKPLHVDTGSSAATDPATAVHGATQGFTADPTLVLAFASTAQDAAGVAIALRERFPLALIAGCSTTGEIIDGEARRGSLVVAGISGTAARFATVTVSDVAVFDAAGAERSVQALFEQLDVDRESFDPGEYFCLLFIDGLSMREEVVSHHLADALDGVVLLGGSAGDDLAFLRTQVFSNRGAASNTAVLVLGHCPGAFHVVKHQHFARSSKLLAVTSVDVANRRVLEIDGRRAVAAYAEAIGIAEAEFTPEIALLHPLCLPSEGERYVRSVRAVEADGSISFYCAIEEGMVLEIGEREDMAASLGRGLEGVSAQLLIVFNCILRQLEATQTGVMPSLMARVRAASSASIGFDTYGEQLNGLHINQTFVALALGGAQ